MSYWDAAYASGYVPWDPGLFDGHLPALVEAHGIRPGRALDIGCGTGKSLVWLARRGFDCTGIDSAPTALRIARELESAQGVHCRWLCGDFPGDFPSRVLPDGSHDFVMDRGWFHLYRDSEERRRIVREVARLLAPGGVWYSLIAATGASQHGGGPPRWSEREVRQSVERHFTLEELRKSVFTPGEAGSMPAWVCVMRPNGRAQGQ